MTDQRNGEDESLCPINDEVVTLLVNNHREFLSFLSKRVESRAVAEDLLQQSLLKAVRTPPETVEKLGVLSWFYQILRNSLIDHYRSSAAHLEKLEELEKASLVSSKGIVPPGDELRAAVCQCMGGLLPTLKPEYAEVLRRVDLNEETIESAAQAVGITVNNLNVRLHRARQALRKSLERACGTCTEHGCLDCTCE